MMVKKLYVKSMIHGNKKANKMIVKTSFCIISWLISALILIPCLILSMLSKFTLDYHYQFHLWWSKFL